MVEFSHILHVSSGRTIYSSLFFTVWAFYVFNLACHNRFNYCSIWKVNILSLLCSTF